MNTLTKTEYVQAVDEVIREFLSRQQTSARYASPYYEDLWKEIERLISSGGKRFRPRLSILAYRAFGGKDVEMILPAAAAQELLHLSLLVHDDIIDRDYLRYGVENVAGAYKMHYKELVHSPEDVGHYANMAALLAGDLLLSGAYLLAAESKVPATHIVAIQKLFGQAIFEVAGGELLDTEAAFRAPNSITSQTVALYKTASYTFILPLMVGALLADLSEEKWEYVKTFGRNLGVAFQLRDDILGIFGDEQLTGKSTIGDIREGKRTQMIEQFYNLANEQQITEFNRYFANTHVTAEQAEIVRNLLVESGARAATEQTIEGYELEARAALKELPIEQACMEELEELIEIAVRRNN